MSNNGIVISVGFDSTSELKSYIKNIETQLAAVNWDKAVGLSDSFEKEFEKIKTQLQTLKQEVVNLDLMDVAKLNNGLSSVTQTANRLQKQFSALVDALPVDIQAKMNKSLGGITDMLEAVGDVSSEIADAISSIDKVMSNFQADVKPYQKYVDLASKLQEVLRNNRKLEADMDRKPMFSQGNFKSLDEVINKMQELYNKYDQFRQQFKESNFSDYDAVKEMESAYYQVSNLVDVFIEKGGDLNQKIFNAGILGNNPNTFLNFKHAIQNDYDALINLIGKQQVRVKQAALKQGYNLDEIMKSGVKDVAKKADNADVAFHLPIMVDEETKTELYTKLKQVIEDTQKVANQNPVHVVIDIASQYRTRLNNKSLDKIKELAGDLKERLDAEIAKGTNPKQIAHLTTAAQNLEDLSTKLYKDISKAYEFEVTVNTDWAVRQVNMFVEITKAKLKELRQHEITLGSQVEVDEAFKAKIEKATEDIINDLQTKTGKIEAALNRIAEFFNEDLGTDKENAFRTERAALQKLADSLNIVKKDVNALGTEFLKFAENNGVKAYTEAANAINVAMESIDAAIKGQSAPEIKIEMNKKEIEDNITNLQSLINRLYDTEGIADWEKTYLESIQKISDAFKDLLGVDAGNKHIAYHYGNLANGSPSHPLGDEIKAWFEGKRNGNRGWSDGTGTYITSDPNEFLDGDFSDDLKKFYALDISKLKLLEKHIEEDAEAYYDFAHKLEQYCYKISSGFTGFDENLQDVDPESLYEKLQNVFGKSAMTFEAFQSFINEMVELIKSLGVSEDGTINNLKLYHAKNKYGIDDIKTRFLKRLGYQGTDFSGTSFDTLKTGSVLFDTADLRSLIIETGKTIGDVIQKNSGIQTKPQLPEINQDTVSGLSSMVEKVTIAVDRLCDIFLSQNKVQSNIDAGTLTQSIIEALSGLVININTESLYDIIRDAISSSSLKNNIEGTHTNIDISEIERIVNSALEQTSIKIDEVTLKNIIGSALEQHTTKFDNGSISESIRAAVDLSSITDSLSTIIALLSDKKVEEYNALISNIENKINNLKANPRIIDADEIENKAYKSKDIIHALASAQVETDNLETSFEDLTKTEKEVYESINNIKKAFGNLLGFNQNNPMSTLSYLAQDIARSDTVMQERGRKISEDDVNDVVSALKPKLIEAFEKSGVNEDVVKKALEALSIESVKVFRSLEHGGIVTNLGRVIGLSSADSSDSTNYTKTTFWNDFLKMGEEVISEIHSHAGDDIWMPSLNGDLSRAVAISKNILNPIKYSTTFTRQKATVLNNDLLNKYFGNYTEDDWDKLELRLKLLSSSIKNKTKTNTNKNPLEAYDEYVGLRNQIKYSKGSAQYTRNDDMALMQVAFKTYMKSIFKDGDTWNDLVKSYDLDKFDQADPYGLNKNRGSSYESLIQIIKDTIIAFEKLDASLAQSGKELPVNFETLIKALQEAQSSLQGQRKDLNEPDIEVRKVKTDSNNTRESIIEDLTELLEYIKSDRDKIINKDRTDTSDELNRAKEKTKQIEENLDKIATEEAAKNKPKKKRSRKKKQAPQEITEPEKSAVEQSIESVQAEAKELHELEAAAEGAAKGKDKVTKANQKLDESANTSVPDINSESEALDSFMNFFNTDEELISWTKRVEESVKAVNKNATDIYPKFDKQQLFKDFDKVAEEYAQKYNKAFGTTLNGKDVSKAFRQLYSSVDREYKDFQKKHDPSVLVANLKSQIDSLSKSLRSAFRGDENAPIKLTETLENIKNIFNEINGEISDEELSQLQQRFSDELGSAFNDISNISTKNMSPEFQDKLASINEELQQLRNTTSGGDFQTSINNIVALAQALLELGQTKVDSKGKTADQLGKLATLAADDKMRNTSMPRKMMREYDALINEILKAEEVARSNGGFVDDQTYNTFHSRVLEMRKQLKVLGIEGKSMSDKVGRSLKNSIISVARMYLSWYRLIAYVRQGIQEVINLDTALTKMSYTMNITSAQLDTMGQQIVSMAKDLSTSVDNISQIYQIYANLQTTQEELAKTAKPTAILANLSGTDAATAADQLQGVLNQFKLTADDASHIVDVYDKVSASIKVDYSKGIAGMADAVKNVGNFANEAGLSFEQLSAIVGRVMQQTRMEGGQIGVSLKTIMTRISKANKLAEDGEVDNKTLSQASQALKRWADIDVYTPSGEFREFDVIMTELADKWDKLSDAEQANISFAIAATRQTAVLRSVLEQWSSAMDLATEAVNTNGNALANQQKYEESIAGKIQSLKTEISALWIELLDSNAIKELIDSVKELVVSLEDGTNGLKPIVNLLATIFKWISKIISVIPTGGLVATILGFKYGQTITGAIAAFTGLDHACMKLIERFGLFKVAVASTHRSINNLKATLSANWLGITISATAMVIGYMKKIHKTTEELHDELTQTYNELSESIDKIEGKIDSLNFELKTQQAIVQDLSNRTLSYTEEQELNRAKEMTSELELQLDTEKQLLAIKQKEKAEVSQELWENDGYLFDKYDLAKFNDEEINISSQEDYIKHQLNQIKLNNLPSIIRNYLGIGKLSGDAGDELKKVQEWLDSYKEYYEYLKDTDPSSFFINDYEYLKDVADYTVKQVSPEKWDANQLSKIFNIDDRIVQKQIQQLKDKIETEGKDFKFGNIWQYVGKELHDHPENYAELLDVINSADFTDRTLSNVQVFIKEIVTRSKPILEEELKRNPIIDLATWYGDPSTVDSDKTWKDITDSLFTGLDKITEFVKTHRAAGESLIGLDVFDATGADDTVFKMLGIGDLNTYLKKYEGDEQLAFNKYVEDIIAAFLKAVGDTENINGFELILEKLGIWSDKAKGGAYDEDVQKAIKAYEKIYSAYKKAKSGELFSGEEVAQLEQEYGSLADKLTLVGDQYKINSDALKDLTNQYVDSANKQISAQIETTRQTLEGLRRVNGALKKYEKEDIDIQIEMTRVAIEQTKARIKLAETQAISYVAFNKVYQNLAGDNDLQEELSTLTDALSNLEKLKEYLNELAESTKHSNELNNDSEIDWIANSLKNIARQAELTKQELDNLFTTSGSLDAVKHANDLLSTLNSNLTTHIAGVDKAMSSYQNEMDKLKPTVEELALVENAFLTGTKAWEIGKYDSETATRLNKILEYYEKINDLSKERVDLQHQIAEYTKQELQNVADYFSNDIGRLEAKLNVATTTKSRQKIIDSLRKEYDAQYAMQIKIAEQEGNIVEAEKLQYEWQEKINELEAQRSQVAIDAIVKKYDRLMSEYENRQSVLEHGLNLTEQKGYMANANYYKALINNELDGANKLLNERNRLLEELSTIDTSSENGLDVWWDTKNKIDDVTKALYESESAIVEWQNAIDDLEYDVFNRIQDTISGVKDEAEFLANLFRNSDLFKYIKQTLGNDGYASKIFQGGYTKEGLAVLGLHEIQLKTNQELAENYAEELADINKKLANDPANVKLLDRRNELLNLQREAINAAEQEKDAILDLVREGYDKQLESMNTLIEKYMEALQAEKDLYDYQKNLSKQTKEIATLRKRIAAYAGDVSEEARSKVQQLTVQLQDAEENLRDTQYDHYLSDQQNILDKLYSNFEHYLDEQMEDRDARLKEIYNLVDSNFSIINETLTGVANGVGTNTSATMKNLWSQSLSDTGKIEDNISNVDTNITAIKSSVNDIPNFITNYATNYKENLKDVLEEDDTRVAKIEDKINDINTNLGAEGQLSVVLGDIKTYQQTVLRNIDEYIKNKHTLTATDIETAVLNAFQRIQNLRDTGSAIGSAVGNSVKSAVSFAMLGYNAANAIKNVLGFASGSRRISKSQLAWTQEEGLEAIIRPSDGAILTPLAKNDTVLNAGATQNIWDMANNPMKFIKENLSFPITLPSVMSSGGNYDIDQSMVITLPNVMNYPEFVSALQSDKRFEKMLQDMTVNQLTNKNALAKYKYNYK